MVATSLLENIYAEMAKNTPGIGNAIKIANKLLPDIKNLIQERNKIAHGTHYIGWTNEAATDFSEITSRKSKASKKAGFSSENLELSKEKLQEFAAKAELLNKLLLRLSLHMSLIVGAEPMAHVDITKDSEFQKHGYI